MVSSIELMNKKANSKRKVKIYLSDLNAIMTLLCDYKKLLESFSVGRRSIVWIPEFHINPVHLFETSCRAVESDRQADFQVCRRMQTLFVIIETTTPRRLIEKNLTAKFYQFFINFYEVLRANKLFLRSILGDFRAQRTATLAPLQNSNKKSKLVFILLFL